ncbi:MAG: PIN domain-containing protein [Verrucomicrobia bacterium]|nr:PIN domain-containing protein [Verrucomicrobiota bacterium]
MKVVFDTNTVLAGAGWRGSAHHCLVMLARRRVMAFATTETLEELRFVAARMHKEGRFRHDPWPILNWYLRAVELATPAPLGKPRSRDPKDEPFLTCALGPVPGSLWPTTRICWTWRSLLELK